MPQVEETEEQETPAVGEILMEPGPVTRVQMLEAAAHRYGLQTVDLQTTPPAADIVGLVPADFAREHEVIPVMRQGDVLTVAVADPDEAAAEELSRLTGLRVELVLAAEDALTAAIEEHYGVAPVS